MWQMYLPKRRARRTLCFAEACVGVPDGEHVFEVWAYWDGDEDATTKWSESCSLTEEVYVPPDPPTALRVVLQGS